MRSDRNRNVQRIALDQESVRDRVERATSCNAKMLNATVLKQGKGAQRCLVHDGLHARGQIGFDAETGRRFAQHLLQPLGELQIIKRTAKKAFGAGAFLYEVSKQGSVCWLPI